jgi:plastocyanin
MSDVFMGKASPQRSTGFQEQPAVSFTMRRALVLCLMLPLLCVSAAAETVIVSVDSTNLRFTPSEVTITEGDEVRFFWSGQALPHNAVAKDGFF